MLKKEYELITLAENQLLQVKNDNLIQRVRNSSIFVEEALIAVEEKQKERHENQEWEAYLGCDHIPKPFKPKDIRKYFFREFHFEKEDIELTINWELATDERSILTQDIDAINKTWKFLRESRPNFGEQYDIRVTETIEVTKRIQEFLEKPNIVLSDRMMKDIDELKFFSYKQIGAYIDNLTYRILCSETAYMDSVGVTTAEYSYKAKNFDIHLWTFKNVPLHLDPQETPYVTVNLHQIKAKVEIPFSALCDNMVFRGLHCHFDHFSAHARYFELPQTAEVDRDLKTCLQKEWETQKKIQAETKKLLIKIRADYEETMRLKAEEEELKNRKRKLAEKGGNAPQKKSKETKKSKKGHKEPLIVTPDLVPLVRNDFLNHNHREHQIAMLEAHPDTFELMLREVNLRKYQILGGVYQLNCLSKPKVAELPKMIMTWYKANDSIEIKDAPIDQTILAAISSRMSMTRMSSARRSVEISKFFKITFQLPDCYCHWGEPLPCLFEEGQSSTVSSGDSSEATKSLNISSPVIINDFNLHQLFTKPLMYDFLESSIPRLISSFKFPEELYDEEEDKKAKATLGRAKLTADEQEKEREHMMQKQLMSFETQNSPERLFPLFKKCLPVVIVPLPEGYSPQNTHPYEYFSEFMSALETIKDSYRKSKFKDRLGNPIKISAEKYDKNIRRPKKEVITMKLFAEGQGRKSEFQGDRKMSVANRSGSMAASEGKILHTLSSLPTASRDDLRKSTKKTGKSAKFRAESKVKDSEAAIVDEDDEVLPNNYSKWSTANFLKTEFNPERKEVTIWTDRLGTFGFAFYRYQHFPFKSWALHPSENDPDEVELVIESVHALFRINISSNGYRALITDFTKGYKTQKVYLEIKEPVTELKILKEKLREYHLNIFPEWDASWYMTGYFSEKHLAAEYHIYSCISVYTKSLKFRSSHWNKLSDRRTMILKFGELRDEEEDLYLLRITPEDVTFVDIKEVCTDLDVIELDYAPTWRNLEWYPDLNHLFISTFNDADEKRVENPSIICYTKKLLDAIRLLSCS